MKLETKQRYLSIAKHHIGLSGIDVEADKGGIRKYLREKASETTPAYWRRLKTAMAIYAEVNGWGQGWVNEYRSLKNPHTGTRKGRRQAMPEGCHSRKKCRKVTESQMERLRANTKGRMRAAIEIIAATGVRPTEIEGMQVIGDRIYIQGAKKDKQGSGPRGADRVLVVDAEVAERLTGWLAELPSGCMESVRKSVSRKVRQIFPRSKYPPTLKSLRHQFGSELKAQIAAGELTRIEAAYMMGHRATKSLAVYGSSKSGSGRSKVRPDAGKFRVAQLGVKDNYKQPPGAKQPKRQRRRGYDVGVGPRL